MAHIDVINTPQSDSEIRAIELDNGLCAVLVSDDTCREDDSPYPAAVSMAVRVGSFFDPPEIQGLSHLLEHMLCRGSKKFRKINFDNYLSKHGGDSNAYTCSEHTIFYLHVQPQYLKPTLDRFSSFFIAPLLDPKCVEGEISVVDSEFQVRKQNDLIRIEQIRAHTAKEGHILNRFYCGNKESLSKANLHEHAKKLYDECYFGGAMKLCVIGGDELDVLEGWVRDFFGRVKKGPPKTLPIPAFNIKEPIWDASISYGLKTQTGHILELLWILPPLSPNFYLERPEQYIVKLLAQQGKGSLFAFFKNEGWTYSLEVKVPFGGCYCTSLGRMFIISMGLTLSGFEKKYELVSYIYQFLKLLRDTKPQRWVMDEFWTIKKREYDIQKDSYPPKFAELLSGNMLRYPLAHVIDADYSSNWNPDAIEDLMKYFTPESMRIDFASESIKGTELKTEPLCDSLYTEEHIPTSFKEEWSSPSELNASLFFPSPNEFIPTSFKFRYHTNMTHPECIVKKSFLKLWYDCKNVPSSFLYFIIYHKGGYSSFKNHLMMRLFTELLNDELNEIVNQGEIAGLSSSITLHDGQLLLKVFGYREKLNLLLSYIWTNFMNFSPTTKRFEIIKEKLKTNLNNMELQDLSDHLLDQILSEKSYSMCKELQELNKISFSDLESFVHVIHSEIFIEGLCTGDVLSAEAMEFSKIFQTTQVKPLPEKDRHKNSVIRLQTKLRRINLEVSDSNSLIKLYFQIGREKGESMRKKAMIGLFQGIISEMLFSKLRTEEKLGYIVECSPHLMRGVHGFCILVISIKHNPKHLLKRVRKFVDLVGDLLENVSDESFEDYKDSVISNLDNGRNATWEQIASERYKFDSYSKEVAELTRIQKKDLIKWYMKYFRSSSCHRIALGLWGSKATMERNGLDTKKKKKKTKKRKKKRNGLRHVKIPKLLKLSSTELPRMTFKKVRKLATNRKSTT